MSKILSVKIPRRQFTNSYINSLNEIVKETLAGFCMGEAHHSFCDKEISFTRSMSGKFYKIEWSEDGEPLLLSDSQIAKIKANMAELPLDAVLIDDNSVAGVSMHSNLNKRWGRGAAEDCVPMDGYYMTTDEPIEQETLDAYNIKPCNCVKRLAGEYVYCIPYDFSVLTLLKVGKYVSIISSALISYSNLQLTSLEYVLAEKPNIDFEKVKVSDEKYTVNDALDFRFELTTKGIKSMMVQDFDGTYYVIYQNGDEIMYEGSSSYACPEIEFSIADLIGTHGEHLLSLS